MEQRSSFGQLIRVLVTRKWAIVFVIACVLIGNYYAVSSQAKTYTSEARIAVNEKDAGGAIFDVSVQQGPSQPERAIQTQVQHLQRRELAEAVIKKLGLRQSPHSIQKQLSVQAVPNTNLITVRVVDRSPYKASAIANAIVEKDVEISRQEAREFILRAADEVSARQVGARLEALRFAGKLNKTGKDNLTSGEVALAVSTYAALTDKLEGLRVSAELEGGPVRIESTAVPNLAATAPKPMRSLAIALGIGVILALGVAFLLEYADRTIKSADEAARLYGAPVIGEVPIDKAEKSGARALVTIADPSSHAAESYRMLRSSLDFVNFEGGMKKLLVTSALPSEGKSTVAANLAASLATSGKKVILVIADFRRPTVAEFFQVPAGGGLSEVLAGTMEPDKALIQAPGVTGLLILPPGKLPPNPSELLQSERMGELLKTLAVWADWVIIDTPPTLVVSDAVSAARWADGVLVVSNAGRSTRDAATRVRLALENVGARVVGAVIWGVGRGGSGGSYSYSSSGYSNKYYSPTGYSTGAKPGVSGRWTRSKVALRWAALVALGSALALGIALLVRRLLGL